MTSTRETSNNGPVETLRDGAIKATIWARFGSNGTFYSVEMSRTYTDEAGNFKTSHSYSGSDLLKVSNLAQRAYERANAMRSADAAGRSSS
jgi:hypothetical protein